MLTRMPPPPRLVQVSRSGLLLLITICACSEKSEPGSCYREKDNACVELGAAQSAAGKRLCSGMKWTPGAQSCPSANRVGTCIGKNGASEYFYSGAPNNYSASGAKSACESSQNGGVFTPTPSASLTP